MTFAVVRRAGDGAAWDLHVETLRQMVADGYSAGEIAKVIPFSRNAIIGKVHRLGLELAGARRASKPREIKPKPPKAPKPYTPRLALEGSGTLETRAKRLVTIAEKAKPVEVVNLGVELLERTGCAFPVGQDAWPRSVLFCNAERDGDSSYCAACRKRMVRPKGAAA